MAKNFLSSWNVAKPNGQKVCVHGFLDNSGFYKTLPWNMRAWHCGGSGNNTLIGFEICEPKNYQNKEYFLEVKNSAIALCTYLCLAYDLDANSVITHCEGYKRYGKNFASNHSDIDHWWKLYQNYTMDDFREELQRAINLRRNGMTFDNAETALDFLVEHGRISNSEYWRKVLVTTRNVEYLIMKWAEDYSKTLAPFPEEKQ